MRRNYGEELLLQRLCQGNGVIRRVGDGSSINCWSDPWIPRKWDRLPSTRRGNAVVSVVRDLINPMTGEWDVEMVKDIFYVVDANAILAMPLREGMEDFWDWFYDPKGHFSVKSAYRLHRDLARINSASDNGGSSTDNGAFDWYQIWNCPCPPNVKKFLWRVAHNGFEVNWNIERRGLEVDPLCPVCKRLNEDGAHLFLKCKGVRKLWESLNLVQLRLQLIDCLNPKQMLDSIFKQSLSTKTKCIALMWTWWKARNKVNKGGTMGNLVHLKAQVEKVASEYVEFFGAKPKTQEKGVNKWKPPQGDVLKINIDGAFDPKTKKGGWGFVVRDARGEVMGAAAGRIDVASDVLHTEAEACSKALHIVQSWGMSRIQIESDSQVLVQAINSQEAHRGSVVVILQEIKESLFLNFICFGVSFCPRACNNVADAIAAYGAKLCGDAQAVWPDHAPDFAQVFVASDLAEPVS